MSDSNSKTLLALVAGALMGGAIGVAAGLIFAPDKGTETRKKVKSKIDELSEDFLEKLDDFLSRHTKTAEMEPETEKAEIENSETEKV